MKYLRQENNRFIFEDGGEQLGLEEINSYSSTTGQHYHYIKGDIYVSDRLFINKSHISFVEYKDIQTAVQMMMILKDKGLV